MNVVEVNNLTKKYKEKVACNDLSFNVSKGEILGLLGPNGSGKTTTINSVLGLIKIDNGKVLVFGEELKPQSYDNKKKIGVVFQDVAVFDELTVYENIEYFCSLYVSDKKLLKEYVLDAIELVGLRDYQKFVPKKLSGGLLRRLNIACGIAHKPELIFFDEPTVAVDPQSRNHILSGIKQLNKNGATIIYTSHYMEEVEILCDRIIIIDEGSVVAQGTKEELKEKISTDEQIDIVVEQDDVDMIKLLKEKGVKEANFENPKLTIVFKKNKNNLYNIINYLKKEKINFSAIKVKDVTLNDVFLELTGKELRD